MLLNIIYDDIKCKLNFVILNEDYQIRKHCYVLPSYKRNNYNTTLWLRWSESLLDFSLSMKMGDTNSSMSVSVNVQDN